MAKRQPEKIATLSHLYAPIPMLTKEKKKKKASLSRLHKIFLLTKDNQKKIASLSHLDAHIPMLHVHAPMFLFPCSYLHASIVTCKKLELTATLMSPCSCSHAPVQMLSMASEKNYVNS